MCSLDSDSDEARFGLSLERPTMLRYKIDNIRSLLGHKGLLSHLHLHVKWKANRSYDSRLELHSEQPGCTTRQGVVRFTSIEGLDIHSRGRTSTSSRVKLKKKLLLQSRSHGNAHGLMHTSHAWP